MKQVLITSLLGIFLTIPPVATAKDPLPFDQAEYALRRAKFITQIPDGIAVIWNSHRGWPRIMDPDFNYLCGVDIPKAVLIVDGIRRKSLLFYTTSEHYLKGAGLATALASDPKAATGIDEYYSADQFSSTFKRLLAKSPTVYTLFNVDEEAFTEWEVLTHSEWDGRLTRRRQFVKTLQNRFPDVEVKDCSELIWELRRIKTPAEIDALRQAGRIGTKAMIEVMKAAKPEQYEYKLSSLFEYVCYREGCRDLEAPMIIISGENHPHFHYNRHDRFLTDGDFLVVDGCPRVKGYYNDISISFPLNGKFSPRQREVYEACLAISKECLALYKPGFSGYDIARQVKEIMLKRGYHVDKSPFAELNYVKKGGITHHVGLTIHDAGGRDLRPDRPLEAGMVFACDVWGSYPGENLGVRIENTVLVTEMGCEILHPGIPREVAEIEALMRNGVSDK
jgi:Xaa-Pro aminopeptidase